MLNRFKSLNLDKVCKGYKLIKTIDVPEFKMIAAEFFHEKTNAKHIHFARDDKNKAFGVQFRTPAPNSSGVPHILEHTVLCGSEKYPVRDPFFKMLTRSQATFMNAMTASDWTMYPFSSLNEKDFFNLLSVYMDAVFKPILDETDFMQEGWRLEPINLTDPTSDFIVKGVVYNEMKGVFSSSSNNLAHKCENAILPITYPYVSGGAPLAIPSLTHEQLKSFHAQLYHPSNSCFFSYGNVDVELVLSQIDDYLRHFDKRFINTNISLEPRWDSPRSIHIHCQPNPMASDPDRQSSVVVSYMIDDSRKSYLNFTMNMISNLLISGDNAPLYKALIESGIGQDWAGKVCGFDSSTRTTLFHIGVEGVHETMLNDVEQTINEVLHEVSKQGFPKERIESYLHQVELSLRHDDANFGLKLLMGLSYGVNHNADLEDLLKSLEYVRCIREDIRKDQRFLEKFLTKYFLDNNHRLTVKMTPKPTYNDEQIAEEKQLIKEMTKNLTDEKKVHITDKCKNLLSEQRKPQNIDCLPCLKIADIPKESERYPFKVITENNIQLNEYSTNGIAYLNMLFSLKGIDADLLQYVPLFTSVITSMSTKSMHYRDIDQEAESCTGGLGSSLHLSGNITDLEKNSVNAGLMLSSHCLYNNIDRMLDLWSNILREVEFGDIKRLSTLIKMSAIGAWSADGISEKAHVFAMRRANANLTAAGRMSEFWNGLEQAELMKSIAQLSDEELAEVVVPKLNRLRNLIFNKNRLRIALNAEPTVSENSVQLVKLFADDLTSNEFSNVHFVEDKKFNEKSLFILPYSVNYASMSIKSVPYQNPGFAISRVLSKVLSSKFLHKEIREIGGAYGSGVSASPGHFSFYSYRDPHSFKTLSKFSDSLHWIINQNLNEQFLNEAKLSVFQDIEKPLSAGSKGLLYFLDGITDEMRQQHRKELFAVSIKCLTDFTSHLLDSVDKSSVLIGPDQTVENSWEKIEF